MYLNECITVVIEPYYNAHVDNVIKELWIVKFVSITTAHRKPLWKGIYYSGFSGPLLK